MQLRSLFAVGAFAAMLAGSGAAHAAKSGLVVVHGTSDLPGAGLSCTGTGDSFKCTVSAAITGYWEQSTIDVWRRRSDGSYRPYAVVGCRFGTRRPWANGTEPAEADCIATQVERFIRGPDAIFGTTDDITDLVVLTHSGGSNHMRFLLQQAAGSTNRTRVKNATRKVTAIAPVHKGTYLANVAIDTGTGQFINGVLDFFAGAAFNDDGTKFIRTYEMVNYNVDPAKLVSFANPIGSVTIRSAGGTYPDAAAWSTKTWCGGYDKSAGLNLTHRFYLNSNNSSLDLTSCSDGFIPCKSMAAMGQVFFGSVDGSTSWTTGTHRYRHHHQTRRNCNGSGESIRAEINSTSLPYIDVQDMTEVADKAPVATWDACQYSVYQEVVGAGGWYTLGCAPSRLGNGKCDHDCFSVYGRDAVPTWSAGPGSRVIAWGADDCSFSSTRNALSTTFNGNHDADAYVEFSKTYWSATCDPAWIDDGDCDQCWVAIAGADGNDCRPGRMSACYGLVADEYLSTIDSDSMWAYIKRIAWTLDTTPAHGNGYCEFDECATYPADCPGLCN